MKNLLILFSTIAILSFSCKKSNKTINTVVSESIKAPELTKKHSTLNKIKITPIEHATMVIEWNEKTIYIDPYGGADAFKGQKKPDMVLITDIHGDHLSIETLNELSLQNTPLVVPLAVAEKLPNNFKEQIIVLTNNESKDLNGIKITGIPMYNLREGVTFHTKGRGNGYVLGLGGKNIYISGDTEDIEEMRALKNIDIALICMNLPYTMPVENAANGVLAFKPKQVYPYHYRNKDKTLSNVAEFKALVNAGNSDIEVIQLDWYPNNN